MSLKIAGVPDADPESIDAAISAWATDMRRRECTPKSIEVFTNTVVQVLCVGCGMRKVEEIDLEPVDALLSQFAETWSGSTHNGKVSHLRNFGAFLVKTRRLTHNPLINLSTRKGGVDSSWAAFTTSQVRALIDTARARAATTGKDRSNAWVYYAFLAYTGVRPEEGPRITWASVLLDQAVLITRQDWQKNGRKDQEIPLRADLVRLLRAHAEIVRHKPGDLVFPATVNARTFVVDRAKAGIPECDSRGDIFHRKSFRKWFATELDRAGASKATVSMLLRHSDTLAEARYIRPDNSAQRAAVELLPNILPENDNMPLTVGHEIADDDGASPAKSTMTNTLTSESFSRASAKCSQRLANEGHVAEARDEDFSRSPFGGGGSASDQIAVGNGQWQTEALVRANQALTAAVHALAATVERLVARGGGSNGQ